MRIANINDIDWLIAASYAFVEECRLPAGNLGISERIHKEFANAATTYHIWDDRGPAALVRVLRRPGQLGRITSVYTPPAQRQRGYAGALVASAAGMLVAEGFDVFLFTDLANPTSNSLYQRIGFQRLEDFAYLKLLA